MCHAEDEIAALKHQLERDPDNLDLLNKVGVYRYRKDWNGSLLEEALRRKRTIRSLSNFASYIKNEQQDWSGATVLWEEAIALKPRFDLPELGYGCMQLWDSKTPELAVPALMSAFEKGRRPVTLTLLGEAYFELGDYGEAAEAFASCQGSELHDLALYGEAAVQRKLGQISRSVELLDQIGHTDSDSFWELMAEPLSCLEIACQCAALGEFERAVSWLDKSSDNYDIGSWPLLGKALFEARPLRFDEIVNEELRLNEATLGRMDDGTYWGGGRVRRREEGGAKGGA